MRFNFLILIFIFVSTRIFAFVLDFILSLSFDALFSFCSILARNSYSFFYSLTQSCVYSHWHSHSGFIVFSKNRKLISIEFERETTYTDVNQTSVKENKTNYPTSISVCRDCQYHSHAVQHFNMNRRVAIAEIIKHQNIIMNL